MDSRYYVLSEGEQTGPYDLDELTEMDLDVQTRVFSPVTGNWQNACDVPELYDYFTSRGINFPTEDNLASFWWRLLAYLIDCTLLSFVLAIVIEIFASNGITFNMQSYNDLMKLQLCFYVVLIIYNSICEASAMKGTVGKKLCHLVVVDSDGATLGYFTSLFRSLGKALSLYFFCLGFISIFFSEHRQALHDYMARCYVIKL